MNITAAMVKELRERTGSGMMECKKALVAAGGDLDVAVEEMRKSGLAKADKKSGRTAAEGCVSILISDDQKTAAMVEVNCETDFVAKGDDFTGFAAAVASQVLKNEFASLEDLMAATLDSGVTADERRRELISKLGENINIRRFERLTSEDGIAGGYSHGSRIGVVVAAKGADEALCKDVAMHVAASKPVCVSDKEVPAETIEKEREIFSAQAEASGKPAEIIAKMVEGRLKKFLAEITLVGQPFVKDPDVTVGKLLSQNGAEVVAFARYEVGEGIEKEEANFADEVMAQVRGE